MRRADRDFRYHPEASEDFLIHPLSFILSQRGTTPISFASARPLSASLCSPLLIIHAQDRQRVVFSFVQQIAFDETGNTGNDLITADQPVFCLASVRVSEHEIGQVKELLSSIKTAEWKFSKMRRNQKQLQLLSKLLEMDWVTPTNVKIFVIFKRYMAITKLVDLIHEPSARSLGVNLYEQGAARGLANLLTLTLPVYLGNTRADRFTNLFVRLIRRRDPETLRQFHREAAAALTHLNRRFPETIGEYFAPIIIACEQPETWLPHLSSSELDPLIPAYYTLADAWGKTLTERFIILADESKTLAQERELLLRFADEGLREQTVGSPTRNIIYPLKVADIITTTSHSSRRVQIADLFAGIAGYAFAPMANQTTADGVSKDFVGRLAEKVWMDGIIPSRDVTPEQLAMEDFVGVDPADYGARILAEDPNTRK